MVLLMSEEDILSHFSCCLMFTLPEATEARDSNLLDFAIGGFNIYICFGSQITL